MYPRGTFYVPNGFFHADERIVFSVVHGQSWRELDEDIPFSEFDWASPQELRLVASLLMCEKMDYGYVRLYPLVRFSPWLDVARIDLQSEETVREVRAALLRQLAKAKSPIHQFHSLRALHTRPYELVETSNFEFARLTDYWRALEVPNYVVLRGMYALIKADMLSCHYEFFEEAIVSLYIALEASFTLVLRRLKETGANNPTAHDAARWLHEHFSAPFGHSAPDATEKYFAEFYEQRIMTLHPGSRFGDVPYAPNMHDDFSHLRPWLRQILAYLVLGEHDAGYVEALEDHRARGFPSTS
jgi:hypothetical protein